jgi:biopolymer transport protein ExbD/biopolymer transport protein TolR
VAFTSRGGHTQTALAEINITPLVDVVLVLLVIFMITAPVLQSGIQVNVPKTKTVHEITEQRTVVTINKDNEVFLNDKPVNLNDLPNILRAQSTDTSKQQIIYLRADQSVSFGTFATLMDAVKQSGITNVSIVTQPAENSPAH